MKKYLLAVLIILFSSILSACDFLRGETVRVDYTFMNAFDTLINVRFWYNTRQHDVEDIIDDMYDILDHIHDISTRFDAVEGVNNIHYINNNPGEIIEVDEHLIEILKLSTSTYENYSTKFNIALGSVLDVWTTYYDMCKKDKLCMVPSTMELVAAAEVSDPTLIEIDEDNLTVKIPEGMMIDLGGVAKGYGAELLGDYLRDIGIEQFFVQAGGSNVEVSGKNPSEFRDYWSVSLKDPDNPNEGYGRIALDSGWNAITSGDYERYYKVDDEVYHHIIDPYTLHPGKYTRTVTVISKDPTFGDIISTIAFLLPIDEGIEFIDSIDGVEAIWFDYNRQVHYSANMKELFIIEVFVEEG